MQSAISGTTGVTPVHTSAHNAPINNIRELSIRELSVSPPSPSGGPDVLRERSPIALAERFDKAWHVAQVETHRKIRRLSPEMRPLLELQSEIQRLGLQTNLAAQAAEAVSSTLRRLQQMGGS